MPPCLAEGRADRLDLAENSGPATIQVMKFLLAVVVYLLISALLGAGILLTFKGNHWLLIVGCLAYAVAFAKLGCLPGKAH